LFEGKDNNFRLADDNNAEADEFIWHPVYGMKLHRPRRLVPADEAANSLGAEPLEALLENISNRTIFISWKHRDFYRRRKLIREFIIELTQAGFAVWWDRYALPPYGSKTNKQKIDNRIIKILLDHGMGQCKALIALSSQHYGQKSEDSSRNWTRNEWEHERVHQRKDRLYRVVYMLDKLPQNGVNLEEADQKIPDCHPEEATLKFKEWFDKEVAKKSTEKSLP
jgi:hypothetical protein